MDTRDEYEEQLIYAFRVQGITERQIKRRIDFWRILDGVKATTQEIEEYLLHFENPGTRRTYLYNIRALYRLAHRRGWIDTDPTADIARVRTPRRKPRPLSDAELHLVTTKTRLPIRHWCILSGYAGLRAIEISRLRREDLQMDGPYGPTLHVIGKGDHEATIPAHPKVVQVIQQYEFFGRLWNYQPNSVSSLTGVEFRRLGIEGSLHRCRHSFATRALRATGGDLLVVRDLMRHTSVATTQIYTALDESATSKAIGLL